ncbi:MAG: hypothetical protein ACE5H1_08815 [Thermodesulfobacteriota bacterium]
MISSLLGAFINVTILTRIAHWILKKKVRKENYRAFLVFGTITLIDFTVWSINKDLLAAIHIMLFYYLPFLILWLLTDIFRARRKKAIIH